jgi:hypothetical protein
MYDAPVKMTGNSRFQKEICFLFFVFFFFQFTLGRGRGEVWGGGAVAGG